MNLSPESITQEIFHRKGGPLGFTEGFGATGLFPPQVKKYVGDSISRIANREINTLDLPGEIFNKLQDLKYLYSIHDDYGYDTDNLEYSRYYSSFTGKNYLDLLPIIQNSSKTDWGKKFSLLFCSVRLHTRGHGE